jgi:hypothetical protein
MGDPGRALLLEPTLRGAIDKFCELAAHETSNLIFDLYPQPNGDLWFGHRMLSEELLDPWHSNLYVLGWKLKAVRLADPAWSPVEILIRSKATQERCEAIEMTGSTARLEQTSTGFMVPASMLALPVAKNSTQGVNKDVKPGPTLIPDSYAKSLKQVIRTYASDGWLSVWSRIPTLISFSSVAWKWRVTCSKTATHLLKTSLISWVTATRGISRAPFIAGQRYYRANSANIDQTRTEPVIPEDGNGNSGDTILNKSLQRISNVERSCENWFFFGTTCYILPEFGPF